MTDYCAVMALLLRQRSYRQIQHQLGCSHRAISRANQALRNLGLTTVEQVAALTNDELDGIFVDRRNSGQGEFVPIDFDSVVNARTGRTKHALQVLWARYATAPAQPGQRHYSYDRFRQLVASHVDAAGLIARITHAPGHTFIFTPGPLYAVVTRWTRRGQLHLATHSKTGRTTKTSEVRNGRSMWI